MKRVFTSRKGVSTMIGGIIVLTLILSALTAMILVSRQYDAYQSVLDVMSQKDTDKFSENLQGIYPGIQGPAAITGCGTQCNQYNMTISNFSGIGIQVLRIYINSTYGTACANLCIFDPATSPQSYKFLSSESYLNPSEGSHVILLWFPSDKSLPVTSTSANTISIATARGRVFSFQWPFPPAGVSVVSDLHLDIGPIRITYNPNLITYTTNGVTNPGPTGCANIDPPSTPCISNGWQFPTNNPIVFYVRMSNIGGSVVKILDKSYLYAENLPSGVAQAVWETPFYVVAPMPVQNCHDVYFAASDTDPSWGSGPGCPNPNTFGVYNSTLSTTCNLNNPCYNLQPGPTFGQAGTPVYVLFSASKPGTPKPSSNSLTSSASSYVFVFFLALSFKYNGYTYGVTIPLLSTQT